MGTGRNCDHPGFTPTINNCRVGTRTDNPEAKANGKILCVGSGPDQYGIARRSQRDGVPDSLTGGLARLAVIVVASVHAVYIPHAAGQGGGSQGHEQKDNKDAVFHDFLLFARWLSWGPAGI